MDVATRELPSASPYSTVYMPSSPNALTNETLVRFARRMSHDLNNFSTVVRTYSELLLGELPATSSTAQDVAEIQRAAEGMVAYLQRVTRFSRAGTMKRSSVPVDAVVQDAVTAFAAAHSDRPVHVDGLSACTVQADSLWLRDVVGELLLNAHEASPPNAPIIVRLAQQEHAAVVQVVDSGDGFASEVAETAMEPFVTTKSGVRGAGMGLALASAFCEAIGGTASFAREGDGAAARTVVTLRLPTA